jgi:hypothetical protein
MLLSIAPYSKPGLSGTGSSWRRNGSRNRMAACLHSLGWKRNVGFRNKDKPGSAGTKIESFSHCTTSHVSINDKLLVETTLIGRIEVIYTIILSRWAYRPTLPMINSQARIAPPQPKRLSPVSNAPAFSSDSDC